MGLPKAVERRGVPAAIYVVCPLESPYARRRRSSIADHLRCTAVDPEAGRPFVGGYPKGSDFGVSLGVRTPAGRDEFRQLFEAAIEVGRSGTVLRT